MRRPIETLTRRLRLPALALAVAWTLAGCTGTFEAGPPTLLVVAFDDGSPQVGLVEDTFRALEATGRELAFVPGSARTLDAPAVAVDVVDRAGERPTAVFLLRGAGSAPVTYLRGFAIAGIDPGSPTAFVEDPSYAFTLANGGAGDEGLLEFEQAADYCPIDAQISSGGRYLAVFEERSVCSGGAPYQAIHVLDLEAASEGANPIVASIFSPAPGGAGIYLDPTGDLDAQGREAVYYTESSGGVKAFLLASRQTIDVPVPIGAFDGSAVVDLGRFRDALALVEADAYVLLDATLDSPTAARIGSEDGLSRFVSDPFGLSSIGSAVLLAGDALVVHDDANADAFATESSAPPRSDALVEPVDQFVYLLGSERIGVFDLLTFQGTAVQVTPFDVPEIPGASVFTWTRASAQASP